MSPILDIFLWYNGFKSGILGLIKHYVMPVIITSSANLHEVKLLSTELPECSFWPQIVIQFP